MKNKRLQEASMEDYSHVVAAVIAYIEARPERLE